MDWLNALTSSGFGAVIGAAGGMFQKFIDIKAKKLEYSYNLSMRKFDVQEANAERDHELGIADKHLERAEVEGEILVEHAEVEAFTESQKTAGQNPSLTYIRASITWFMLLACTALFVAVWIAIDGLRGFSNVELHGLLDHMVRSCIFLAVTCVTWWFAARDGNLKFKK